MATTMTTAEEALEDTFSADNIIARALMNDTPSSALEEPDPHCMLSPSMVVPQAVWMVDDNTQADIKNILPPGVDITPPAVTDSISYTDHDTTTAACDDALLDSLSSLAQANSNLFILNIPNSNLTGTGGIGNSGQCNLNATTNTIQQTSSLMPVLLVGGGGQKGGETADQNSLPSFLRFKDFAQANLIYTTQENIAKTYNAPEQPKPVDKVIKCEECGRSFKSSGHYRYHLETHKGNRVLKCPISGCNRRFAWPGHLKYHVRTHSNDRPYPCKMKSCRKTFYTVQSLGVHMRSHTGLKPFECPEEGCGKSFTTSGNLTNHIRTHTGEKPFACTHEDCNLRFAEKSSLKKHKLTHTGEKPYECEVCGKLFSQCSSRNAHRKRHTQLSILDCVSEDPTLDCVTEDPSRRNSLTDSRVLDLTLGSSGSSLTGDSESITLSVQDAMADQGDSTRLTLNQSVLEGFSGDRAQVDKSSLEDPTSTAASMYVISQPCTTLTMATNPPLNHNPANPGDSLLCNAFLQSELEPPTEEVVTVQAADDMGVHQGLGMPDSLWSTHD